MKKIKYLLFVCAFMVVSFASANETDPAKEKDSKERIEQLEERVYEIWKMDFSDMEKDEKAVIKAELKDIKKELKQTGLDNKVSISIGAIIIILLLIIIIS